MIFNTIKSNIENGIKGLNKGLPHGLNRLVEYIPGIQQSTYYLIGGETSSGKSAFTNNCFVYNPIDWYLKNKDNTNIKINVEYYSFEITKEIMLTKAICRKIYIDTGLLLDVNYILSRGKNKIKKEHYDLVLSYSNYFAEFEDLVKIYDVGENPTGIFNKCLRYASHHGKGITNDYKFDGDYIPNNPNLYTIIVVDHVGLLRKERGFQKKEIIDKLSEYLIILRNKCNFTPVVISQFNRSISSTDRFKLDRVEPQLSDFKDSSATQDDANIVIGLFSPSRYELEEFRGYNTKLLGNRFRSVSLLKNRDGESDKILGVQFIGECGHFSELPKANEMTNKDYENINKIKKSI